MFARFTERARQAADPQPRLHRNGALLVTGRLLFALALGLGVLVGVGWAIWG
ncbi:MAG: hypothetical protein ACXWYO_04155 [Gaiellaceae bacterium]